MTKHCLAGTTVLWQVWFQSSWLYESTSTYMEPYFMNKSRISLQRLIRRRLRRNKSKRRETYSNSHKIAITRNNKQSKCSDDLPLHNNHRLAMTPVHKINESTKVHWGEVGESLSAAPCCTRLALLLQLEPICSKSFSFSFPFSFGYHQSLALQYS